MLCNREERQLKIEETKLERLKIHEEESQAKLLLESAKDKERKAALEHKLDLQAQMIWNAQRRAAEEEDHVLEAQVKTTMYNVIATHVHVHVDLTCQVHGLALLCCGFIDRIQLLSASCQAAREAEIKYNQRITEALKSQPPDWYGRKKVEWFH